jgi:hypothetical protein
VKHWWREEGQQVIQVALLLPLLLTFLGLVIDVGNVYVHHQMVQSAADAAATAGGMVLYQRGATVAIATAYYYAAQHGYDNDGTTNVVQATVPPVSGPYARNKRYLQVQIEERVEPFFASLVWDGTFRVRASAVAGWTQQEMEASVIVLNETACGALSMDGNNARIKVLDGNIHVNSSCSSAVDLGNGDIWSETALTIRGGYSRGPNGYFLNLQGQPLSPLLGQPLLPDPLAGLPAPDPTGMPHRSVPKEPTTLEPGIYDNGIKLSGNDNVTLQPGIYILYDDFDVSGTAQVTGHDVFIYLANGATINFHGNRAIQLDAPDSGTYQDILIFQARGNTATGYLTGTTDSSLEGIIYMPNGELWLSGNATLEVNFVVDELRLNGNPDLSVAGFDSRLWVTVTDALVE